MRFEAPDSAKAAAKLLAAEKGIARVLAGGTDLLVQMRSGMIEPDLVVDIKHIRDMRKIRKHGGQFVIGAGVSSAEMGENAALVKAWPGVVEAANLIGSTQIQGRCTVAGNLCNASPAPTACPPWWRPAP